jgi:hypothetical protein
MSSQSKYSSQSIGFFSLFSDIVKGWGKAIRERFASIRLSPPVFYPSPAKMQKHHRTIGRKKKAKKHTR